MKYAWIAFLLLCSCNLLTKRTTTTHNRDVAKYISNQNQYYTYQAKQELGFASKTSFTSNESNAIHYRAKLLKQEDKLQSPILREQYFQNKAYFQNDRQRLYFLSLPTLQDREAYLQQYVEKDRYPASIQAAIEKQDLVPYMTKNAVIAAWGKPEEVEVSGNPIYSNERWMYRAYRDSELGEIEESRYLYFENGQLVAWETKDN